MRKKILQEDIKWITFRLEMSRYEKLRSICEEREVSLSALIRRVLVEYLKNPVE